MLKNCKKYGLLIFAVVLLFADIFVFYLDWQNSHRRLTFAVLDIGQGDALFIESPTGSQIMFDAGPARKILAPLSKVMPFYDKTIDAIVITNPDADHIGGFLDVLKNYKVGKVFEPGTSNDSKTYQNLEAEIKKQNIPNILVKKDMRLDIGGGAFIDILFPDRDVSLWARNEGSVVAKLTYGKNSVMLTGDATKLTEKIILEGNSREMIKSDILKVGHHGSRTSTGSEFLKAIGPQFAVISDGKENKYGHPHKETLDTLSDFSARISRTDILGSIIFVSDGNNFLLKD